MLLTNPIIVGIASVFKCFPLCEGLSTVCALGGSQCHLNTTARWFFQKGDVTLFVPVMISAFVSAQWNYLRNLTGISVGCQDIGDKPPFESSNEGELSKAKRSEARTEPMQVAPYLKDHILNGKELTIMTNGSVRTVLQERVDPVLEEILKGLVVAGLHPEQPQKAEEMITTRLAQALLTSMMRPSAQPPTLAAGEQQVPPLVAALASALAATLAPALTLALSPALATSLASELASALAPAIVNSLTKAISQEEGQRQAEGQGGQQQQQQPQQQQPQQQ